MSRRDRSTSSSKEESRVDLATRLRGPLAARDKETVDHWRSASPAAHATAMIELARYAERMAAQTGFGKRADDMFPGFPMRSAHQPPAGEAAR